jgi:hypothetical protein
VTFLDQRRSQGFGDPDPAILAQVGALLGGRGDTAPGGVARSPESTPAPSTTTLDSPASPALHRCGGDGGPNLDSTSNDTSTEGEAA